ncbi:MAG: hypothetical protein MI919_15800, partial [Holophagales bacterium]|nr:hypothetical protein [Holophagales bacterium]
ELWAFAIDGRDAWALTRVTSQGGAVLDPAFSFEGGRLAWSERVDTTRGGHWGDWVVRVADFEIRRGLPRIGDVQTFDGPPWPGLVMIEGFTENDRGLWLTTSPRPGSQRRGRAVGMLDLDSGSFTPVPTPGQWDEGMTGVPRGERRVWLSDRDIDPGVRLNRRTDLWVTSPTGRLMERLTYLNDARSSDSLGEAYIADTSWSPDGRHLLLQVITAGPSGILEDLYVLDLSAELAR